MAAAAAASIARKSLHCCTWTRIASPLPRNEYPSILRRSFRQSSISSRLKRESSSLTSLLPFYTATASARFVSMLPSESNASIECRYTNYMSPI